ncbi:Aspartic proteinase nepenthesin-1 [Acorus gramineus]|uniref:Aspartic proteinase nepenthesin-1 n=1 Tax=Acorus gramineus TaxID=55184 RepID=A0AAV9BM64_ACOGR|nr:Aspartic proteinase nepenthesin-1 [Acorus gramineus]
MVSILLQSFLILLTLSTTTTTTESQQHYTIKLPLLRITPSITPQQSLIRDRIRYSSLFSSSSSPPSPSPSPSPLTAPLVSAASSGSGQYLVDLRLGIPPQPPLRLVADTGSDLIWTRCSACLSNCSSSSLRRHRHRPSAFHFRRSSSFRPHHCYDPPCRLVPHPRHRCDPHRHLHNPCRYSYTYSDLSVSAGYFSRDVFTLNSSSSSSAVRRLRLSFGCAANVSGPSLTGSTFGSATGVLGLGRGPTSFPSQIASSRSGGDNDDVFSYCLMDYTLSPPPTSFLLIGGFPSAASTKMRFTPLLPNPPTSPTFYYVGIESVSVDGSVVPIDRSIWAVDSMGGGGTVVDSGTTLTFLPGKAYRKIVAAVQRRLTTAEAAAGFDLCVNTSSEAAARMPRVEFGLRGGAKFGPPPENYFIEAVEGLRCLAMQAVRSGGGTAVIGNLMQQGFLFVFDRAQSRLGFTRTDCASL